MKRLLYLGNYQIGKNKNPSYMEILGPLLEKEGYELVYGSSVKYKIGRLFHMLRLCIKHSKEVDFVLIDTYSTLNFYYALFCSQLCRNLNLKYICLLHGGKLPNRLEANPVLSKLIFENSLFNVAPSQYLFQKFKEHNFKTIHIPNVIEIEKYPFKEKIFESPNLLWLRSFSKIYNPNLAIKTLAVLKPKYKDASLCMIGPNKDGSREPAEDLAKELCLHVTFTGKLSRDEWVEQSLDANIFINTSNYDNMPISVIEAMALGFPIVSTNVGGMPNLIEHEVDGLLVPSDEPKSMAKAITRILNDVELRNKLIINARKKAENYDWHKIKDNWLTILDR